MFGKRPQRAPSESRVLVCCLDPCVGAQLDVDASVYSRHYKRVDVAVFHSVGELLRAVELCYDIVHPFTRLAPGGLLVDAEATLLGSDLIAKCCERDVKLLWIADENKPDDYVKGFRATGKRLNLIMTLNRNGASFDGFLEGVLSRVSRGDALPSAWVAMVPQAPGSWQRGLPSCIFFAGRPDASLLG